MMGVKPSDMPMEQNHRLCSDSGELLGDPGMYQRLAGRLIYLTISRPHIGFAVSVVSQFMHAPRTEPLKAIYRILKYLKRLLAKV